MEVQELNIIISLIQFQNILACFAWVFFRANTLSDSINIFKKILQFKGSLFIDYQSFLYGFTAIAFLLIAEYHAEKSHKKNAVLKPNHTLKEQLSYALLGAIIILFGVFDGGQFIYFQF